MEAMIPIEIDLSLTRRIGYSEEQNKEVVNVSLEFVEEKWDDS